MMQMTTLGQAAKDEYEFGNSLEDVSNKKKKILERQLATEERAVNTTQPLLCHHHCIDAHHAPATYHVHFLHKSTHCLPSHILRY